MADAPQQHPTPRVVIPLFPERAAERRTRWLAPLLQLHTRLRPVVKLNHLRVPAEMRAAACSAATKLLGFTAPSVLLAGGVMVFSILAALIAATCGVRGVNATAIGFTAGGWTFLGTTGYALIKRGWSLALLRWR